MPVSLPVLQPCSNNLGISLLPFHSLTFHSHLRAALLYRGMNTEGAPFISSPPDEIVKENGTISPLRLSPTIWLETRHTISSPARHMLDDFSRLKHQGVRIGTFVVTYHLRSVSLFQGMASPALMANTSAAPAQLMMRFLPYPTKIASLHHSG